MIGNIISFILGGLFGFGIYVVILVGSRFDK